MEKKSRENTAKGCVWTLTLSFPILVLVLTVINQKQQLFQFPLQSENLMPLRSIQNRLNTTESAQGYRLIWYWKSVRFASKDSWIYRRWDDLPIFCPRYSYSMSAIWSLIKLILNFNFLLGSVLIVEDSSKCFGLCSNLMSRRDSCEMCQFFSTRKHTLSVNVARTIQGQLY